MSDELDQLLQNLHLGCIRENVQKELGLAEKSDSSYSEFLLRLLRAQWRHRQETSLASRIRVAKVPDQWSLESFPWKKQPGVTQRQIRELAELHFVPNAENIVLMVIDEMGYLNLKPEQTNIFFRLMEERYGTKSTITTNLEFDDWHNFLGNDHLVKALLSRLCHKCHTLRINGPSLRTAQI